MTCLNIRDGESAGSQYDENENHDGSIGASKFDALTALEVKRSVVYYVRSSQQPTRPSRYSNSSSLGETSYEVRLRAWNCTCPAFTFSAFNRLDVDSSKSGEEIGSNLEADKERGEVLAWRFGGLMRGEEGLPVCKHLLACLVAEQCKTIRHFMEERVVSRAEAAGWGAGWGG